jgi:ParB family chromosome partitioning protein
MVQGGQLSVGHGKLLAGVADLLEQQRLAELCMAQELSVRNLERMLAGEQSPPGASPPSRPAPSPHLVDLEKTIARQLGMRVQVRSGRKGSGRLVIHYASLDQFDDLMRKMGIQLE